MWLSILVFLAAATHSAAFVAPCGGGGAAHQRLHPACPVCPYTRLVDPVTVLAATGGAGADAPGGAGGGGVSKTLVELLADAKIIDNDERRAVSALVKNENVDDFSGYASEDQLFEDLDNLPKGTKRKVAQNFFAVLVANGIVTPQATPGATPSDRPAESDGATMKDVVNKLQQLEQIQQQERQQLEQFQQQERQQLEQIQNALQAPSETVYMSMGMAGSDALYDLPFGIESFVPLKDVDVEAVFPNTLSSLAKEKEVAKTVLARLRELLARHQESQDDLVLGDSQGTYWLPQDRRFERSQDFDLAPDGFVIARPLFQVREKPKTRGLREFEGQPALEPPLLGCVRCLVDVKAATKATGTQAVGQARMFADAICISPEMYRRHRDVARTVELLHILVIDTQKFRALVWGRGTLIRCVQGDLTSEKSATFVGRFLLGPGSRGDAFDRDVQLPREVVVNPVERLVLSALAQAQLQDYKPDAERPVLGRGATGIALRLSRRNDDKVYAVKLVQGKRSFHAENEISVMQHVQKFPEAAGSTPKLVDYFSWAAEEDTDDVYALVTLPVGQALRRFGKWGEPFIPSTDGRRELTLDKQILKQIITSIDDLHTASVVHCDLRIENIIYVDSKFLLIDLSHAQQVQAAESPNVYAIDFARLFASIKNTRASTRSVPWKELLRLSSLEHLQTPIEEHIGSRSLASTDALASAFYSG